MSEMSIGHAPVRHDWTRAEIGALFALPFTELLHRAASVHRQHFNADEVQVSTLLSVKTGGCPEDCGYCPQAQRYHTGVDATKLMACDDVLAKAQNPKELFVVPGATHVDLYDKPQYVGPAVEKLAGFYRQHLGGNT